MTQINKETPASLFLLLYNEFKYDMKYGWPAKSTDCIDNIIKCISELEHEATRQYILDGNFV